MIEILKERKDMSNGNTRRNTCLDFNLWIVDSRFNKFLFSTEHYHIVGVCIHNVVVLIQEE